MIRASRKQISFSDQAKDFTSYVVISILVSKFLWAMGSLAKK